MNLDDKISALYLMEISEEEFDEMLEDMTEEDREYGIRVLRELIKEKSSRLKDKTSILKLMTGEL